MKNLNHSSWKMPGLSTVLPALLAFLFVVFQYPVTGQDFFSEPLPVEDALKIVLTYPEGDFVHPTLVDIDDDGDLDLFYSNNRFTGIGSPCAEPLGLFYYENDQSQDCPGFQLPQLNPFGIPKNISRLTFVDIDNDGDLDLFSHTWCADGVLTFIENTGTSTAPDFGQAGVVVNPFGLDPAGIWSPNLIFGDLDNDGDYDAFISGRTLGYFQYQENTGTATEPQFAARVEDPFGLQLPSEPENAVRNSLIDWDCDGDLDMFTSFGYTNLYFYENSTVDPANPSFSAALELPNDAIVAPSTFVDLDGDGDMDGLGFQYFVRNIAQHPGCVTPPTAAFSFTANGLSIEFHNESAAISNSYRPAGWFWDFGDGDVSVEENPTHTFITSSSFDVCLTVSDVAGVHTYCESVQVSSSPPAQETFRQTFKLYANPATDYLYLELISGEALQNVEISIFDALGQTVKMCRLGLFGPGATERIHVAELPAGGYTIKVTSGDRYFTQQWVKVKP